MSCDWQLASCGLSLSYCQSIALREVLETRLGGFKLLWWEHGELPRASLCRADGLVGVLGQATKLRRRLLGSRWEGNRSTLGGTSGAFRAGEVRPPPPSFTATLWQAWQDPGNPAPSP